MIILWTLAIALILVIATVAITRNWEYLFLLLFVLVLGAGFLFGLEPIRTENGVYPVEIVQLKTFNQSKVNGGGSFLGWSLSGETNPCYVVMQKQGEKMIRVFLPQKDTYVVESDTYPRVEYRSYVKTYDKLWAFPTLWDEKEDCHWTSGVTIYVPKGTVILNFDEINDI